MINIIKMLYRKYHYNKEIDENFLNELVEYIKGVKNEKRRNKKI